LKVEKAAVSMGISGAILPESTVFFTPYQGGTAYEKSYFVMDFFGELWQDRGCTRNPVRRLQ